MSRAYPDKDDIVITGTGGICSLGNSVSEIWDRLTSDRSDLSAPSDSDPSGFGIPCAPVGLIPDFRTDVHPQLAKAMGKHLSLLLKSAEEAYGHSCLGSGSLEPKDIGFFAGMGMVDYHIEDLLPSVLKSLRPNGDLDYEKFFSRGYQEI
jgi:3-oxoacyl-(acyl-carrier-protein) synthase